MGRDFCNQGGRGLRLCSRYLGVSGEGMLHGAVPDSSRVVSGPSRTCGACVLKKELEWRRAESRVRGWSSGRRLEAGGEVDVVWAETRSRNTPCENTHTHHTTPPRWRSFSIFYRARSSEEGIMPNSTSSPESGALIGPDPLRGPPA